MDTISKDLYELRRQQYLKNIVDHENEFLKDKQVAVETLHKADIPEEFKFKLLESINSPTSGLGKALAAGISGIAAPFILGYIAPNQTSSLAKLVSIPIGALTGSTLYDYINTATASPQFKYTLPLHPYRKRFI